MEISVLYLGGGSVPVPDAHGENFLFKDAGRKAIQSRFSSGVIAPLLCVAYT